VKLKDLENLMVEHLKESGEIRADIKWLKRAFWTLAGAGLTFNIVLAGYAFNHFINK
jgi:hypothetical protein